MLTPLTSTQTVDRARAALQSGRGAGLPELLKLIETLTTNHAEVTIDELSELIEKDAAVLTRVLGVANTVAHNPGFTPMASVAHAIHQIGFTRVRSLAVSLMLVENAGDRNPPEQREAAAEALCAGLLAQGAANTLGNVDSDLAFACAALRQFGYILLPAVSVEHHREARARLKTQSEDIAYRALFGVTPLELSRKILAPAKLPEEISRSLRDCQPETMGGVAASTYDGRLLGIADFGGRLARLTLDGTSNSELFVERSRKLAKRYEKVFPSAADLIEPALLHTDDRISSFTRGTGGALPTASLSRIKARANREDPDIAPVVKKPDENAVEGETPATTPEIPAVAEPAIAPAADPAVEAPATPAEGTAAPEITPPALAPLDQLASAPKAEPLEGIELSKAAPAPAAPAPESWADALTKNKAFETQPAAPAPAAARETDPWSSSLKLVRDNFGAQECWAFLPKAGGQSLPLSYGVGEHWQDFKTRAAVRADERTVFGVCLTRRENVVIHDTNEASLAAYLPVWFRKGAPPPGAFLLIPLHEEGKSHGLVLIGWKKPQKIAVAPAQLELGRQLFANISSAERAKAKAKSW